MTLWGVRMGTPLSPSCFKSLAASRGAPLESIAMKNFLIAATLAAFANCAFAADVGVSVSIGQPGFYGRIVLGNVPQPQVIYSAPVIIRQGPVGVVRQPIYLRVPPGHEKKWNKHCGKYNACGQPVYFVQDNWYQDVYAPRYRDNGERSDKGHGKRKKNKGHGHD